MKDYIVVLEYHTNEKSKVTSKQFQKMNSFGIDKYDLQLHHRYPNLTNWNTQQKSQRHEKESQWSYGDPKKTKRAVNRFVQTTSLHGVQYVCSKWKTTWILKLLFRIIFAFCFVLLIATEVGLLQDAFSKESTYINSINKDSKLGKEEDPGYFPDYPAITVCRRPPYRTDFNQSYMELVEYIFLSLGFPMVSFTPHELSMVVQMAMHSNDTFTLDNETLAFHDKLIKLEKRLQALESQGNFNLTQFVFEHSIGTYSCSENGRVRLVEQGFNVFLTDPKDLPTGFTEDEGQKIVPGFVTTISTHLVKRQRTALHTAWHGGSTNCPTLFGNERFSHKECFSFMTFQDQKDICKCTPLLQADSKSKRICGPYDQYGCIFKASTKSNLTDVGKKCHEPCIFYRFQSKVSCMSLGGQNISRVEILYNAKQYVYREYRKTTFSSLFIKDAPSTFSVGYELSFLSHDESTLNIVEVSDAIFKKELHSVPLRVHRDELFGEKRAALLQHDILTVQCKIWEVEGSILETEQCFAETEIEVQRYSSIWTIERFSNLKPDSHENLLNVNDSVLSDNFPSSTKMHTTSSLSWKDDLLAIHNDGHFCDTKLKASTEVFPIHSLILRIRSSVFNDMLNAGDCEHLKGYVNIDDMDANTVHKMIMYLYTDTLDDMDWESAKNLHSASKYEIASLKHLCSCFLKVNLESTNCCYILCLADKYQDHNLISAVQSFISSHDEIIFVSVVWRNLEDQNPSLACKTLRKLYMEK
ncbi:Speckle-type POZ protein like [Argiope bruennichi]|uniref:Speckle-type POZ protein like n=1 Tax=Argiope bruennichi TaxID=94029 RepID=A0A8T0EG04_ARGBR|nr:Speckle-type POZ protein like [Argiope bruennichi]